jgi:hypothetical protein
MGLIVLILLGGCANGDFGRVQPWLIGDGVHDWVGTEAPGRAGRPPSNFPLTDSERQMRDLAYPLIEPPYDRQRWYSVLSEYNAAGLFFDGPYPNRKAYADKLMGTSVRSQNARYSKLIEDIRNDAIRVDPFFAVARYVLTMDRKRAETLAQFPKTNAVAKGDARTRVAENTAVIKWVQSSLRERAASYQVALEQLAVAAPSPMAAEVERSLVLLYQRIDANQRVLQANATLPASGVDPALVDPMR